jgi:aminopeptidase N
VLIEAVRALGAGRRVGKAADFIAALGGGLGDASLEPAYRAQFLRLPSEGDIARVIGRDVDPLVIHRARNSLRRAIGLTLYQPLSEIYRRGAAEERYSPSPEAAGRRALRLAALGYIAGRGRPQDIACVFEHYAAARNATDEVSALAMLSEVAAPARQQAFDRFYERWKGDHLVIDNWFAYQAASPLASTLALVKRLTRHPLFSIKNPNKVHALIGTFATGNPVNFNRPDGRGFEFVADRVLEIDAFNPQVAARLLAAFRSFKALEAVRRRAARKALQRIAKAKPLSRDALEIVARMLD